MSDPRLALATVLVATLACLGCPTPDNPCADDAFGCENNYDGLPMDEGCALEGELAVVAGWGLDEFHGFDEAPRVHQGFQGGQHLFVGARVSADVWSDEPMLQLRMRTFLGLRPDSCVAAIQNTRLSNPEDLPEELRNEVAVDPSPARPVFVHYGDEEDWLPPLGPSRCWERSHERVIIIGDDEDLVRASEDEFELVGVFLEVPYTDEGQEVVVAIDALDRCARTGFDVAAFAP